MQVGVGAGVGAEVTLGAGARAAAGTGSGAPAPSAAAHARGTAASPTATSAAAAKPRARPGRVAPRACRGGDPDRPGVVGERTTAGYVPPPRAAAEGDGRALTPVPTVPPSCAGARSAVAGRAARTVPVPTALADRTYRRLFAAQVISLAGTGRATVALGLLAYDLAGADAGLVLGTLAGTIVADQTAEVETMEQLLADM